MTPSPSEPVQGKLPEEIEAAIEKMTRVAAAFAQAHASDRPAIARAYDTTRSALEATILKHLNATREALSRQESDRG